MAPRQPSFADRSPRIAVRGHGGAVPLTPEHNPTAQVLLPCDDEPTAIEPSPEE
jgi:hypothetical protein